MQNKAGKYALPGIRGIKSAAAFDKKFAADNSLSIVNPPKSAKYANAYPICTYTYIILPRSTAKADALKQFVTWAIGDGQQFATKLIFAPLPSYVVAKDKQILKQVKKPRLGDSAAPCPPRQHSVPGPAALKRRGRFRPGDALLYVLTLLAGLAAVVLLILITWKVLAGAWPSIRQFGLGFVTDAVWNPVTQQFGAAWFIAGTLLTSLVALAIAGPISIAIALFLTELAPRWIRSPVGALVEMLASIPSVVLGLWGLLVLGPFIVYDPRPVPRPHPWLDAVL